MHRADRPVLLSTSITTHTQRVACRVERVVNGDVPPVSNATSTRRACRRRAAAAAAAAGRE